MTGPIMGGIAGDPSESNQDVRELNLMTLIGCTAERGDAWHKRDDLQGDESNHYAGFIPREDVMRRLFSWDPQRADVAYLVPLSAEQTRTVLAAGPQGAQNIVVMDGKAFRVVKSQEGRVGVLREDNDYDLGVFKSGAHHPPYSVTLLREAERLTGTTLGISTAGLLQKGGVAWMEFSMPQACHDDKSGLEYRPNLLRADSMNGTISLTTALTIEATVCMNTLSRNLLESNIAGTLVRRKHTSGVVTRSLDSERSVLGILEQIDQDFVADPHRMIETPVSEFQRIKLMDIIAHMTDGMSKRSRLLAGNKRDRLSALSSNPMVSPWVGTAFGEFQRYNTDDHWNAPSKGTGQWERNSWRKINGKRQQFDRSLVLAMEKALA